MIGKYYRRLRPDVDLDDYGCGRALDYVEEDIPYKYKAKFRECREGRVDYEDLPEDLRRLVSESLERFLDEEAERIRRRDE